jgi:predicted GNAT family acetyltransferase
MMHDFSIQNNREARQFEAQSGDAAAFLQYELSGASITLVHTEVPAVLEGKGIGSALAKTGLEYARAHDLSVTVECPFVRGYIERHPEYQDLVQRAQPNAQP